MSVQNTGKLSGRTIFITGASRGIGKAIAIKCARDGANIIIAAKTAEPHPKLPGTIYTAAKEVEAAGGQCLPLVVDIRDEETVKKAVDAAVKRFGGIDVLVNNASAIHLTGTEATPMKRYDLMMNINTRGTFMCSKYCIPHLLKGKNPQILNLSPPLSMKPIWFKTHCAYTMAKYGMSMCVLGMSEEFRSQIGVNALWPRTAIHTAAMDMLAGDGVKNQCRKPEIMADAAYHILCRDRKTSTGNFYIDQDVVIEAGVKDLDPYAFDPKSNLMIDMFLEDNLERQIPNSRFADGQDTQAGGPDKVFAMMKGLLTKELVQSTGVIYQFNITDAGEWYVDLKNGSGSIGKVKPPGGANCTFVMNQENFSKMFAGQINPQNAFMTGKLKIKGDMTSAMKLERLMSKMKSKI